MDIHIHDTLTGTKRRFEPRVPDSVSMYVCGPTVYNLAHIGNALPEVAFDVLARLLRLYFKHIKYVHNITDIDDKINAAALANGEPIRALADRFAHEYRADIAALGVLEPDVEPRATEHISEIIDMIGTLIDRGHAYESEGHVLFHVPSDPNYGSLSKQSLENILEGARVEVAPYKRDPKDFVLWKPSSDELPGWDSPWGRGRPGWHIECSAMIRKHLGPSIDIHGGGSDLTFPHHENELAQGTCVEDGQVYVRYWMHNGLLRMGDEKMSKSLGNIATIRELRSEHPGEVLRYALLSGHYRGSLEWSDDLIRQARASLDGLYQALVDAPGDMSVTSTDFRNAGVGAFPESVLAALRNDLNTPQALAAMHAIAGDIHRSSDPASVEVSRNQLLAGGWLLGILGTPANDWFQQAASVDPGWVEAKIEERAAARHRRDFARADAIRDELGANGIELEDSASGTRWKVIQ
ncbi:MAG: cysteine--tRNA ligase [Gammaproteobacteria bacterium]|nr:cysteine--tRNA ligase [Gammaproteobacteria bacterium]MDE0225794.1 cysteine--tRNA ligase [Gammaproteobacteria bacterium]